MSASTASQSLRTNEVRWADASWDRDDPQKRFEQMKQLSMANWQHTASPAHSVLQSAERVHMIEGIEDCRNLEINWDGDGALPPSEICIRTTLDMISLLSGECSPNDWAANSNGTISLYWEWPNGRAELECGSTRFSWVIVDRLLGDSGRVSCSGSTESIAKGHAALSDFIQYLAWAKTSIRATKSTQVSELHVPWYIAIYR